MALTLFAFLIVFFLGYRITKFFLGKNLNMLEYLPASMIAGLSAMAYGVLALALITNDLRLAVYLFLAGGFFLSLFLWLPWQTSLPACWQLFKKVCFSAKNSFGWRQFIFVTIIIILFANIALKTLVFDNGSYKGSVSGYGDIPFHMSQMSYFAHNKPFTLTDPTFADHTLNYPFLINLLSAALYVLNNSFIFSFHAPALVLGASALLLCYLLFQRVIKRLWVRAFSFLIFFLGGGLGFMRTITDNNFWSLAQKSLSQSIYYLLHLPYPIVTFYDVKYPHQNMPWASFFTMFMVHQRAFFFGFALGVLAIFALYLAYVKNDKRVFCFAGALIGLAPLIHTYTFVTLGLTAIAFLLTSFAFPDRTRTKNLVLMIILSAFISIVPMYILNMDKLSYRSFISFRLGWMTEQNSIGAVNYDPATTIHIKEWLSFMWINFGLVLPAVLAVALYCVFRRSKNGYAAVMPFALSALMILIFTNLVKLQPWDYDTNKIIAYALLFGALLIGVFFDRQRKAVAKAVFSVLLSLSILTNSIDALSRSTLARPALYEIFSVNDINVADWILKNTASSDLILTGTSHLNPVNALAGRPVVVGYPGWLWTHGINYQMREKDIKDIFSGNENAEALIRRYGIKYVLIGPREKETFKPNEPFFDERYVLAKQIDSIKIYKIHD